MELCDLSSVWGRCGNFRCGQTGDESALRLVLCIARDLRAVGVAVLEEDRAHGLPPFAMAFLTNFILITGDGWNSIMYTTMNASGAIAAIADAPSERREWPW